MILSLKKHGFLTLVFSSQANSLHAAYIISLSKYEGIHLVQSEQRPADNRTLMFKLNA
jgi:hypothetical protein